ncbi:MAG TPA: leucine-rich repeat domain-containing protein [Tissierellaceae bacterium]
MNKNYKKTLKVSLLLVLILLIISPLKYTFGKAHRKTSKNTDTEYRTKNQEKLGIPNEEYDSLNEIEKDVINNPNRYFNTQVTDDKNVILGPGRYTNKENFAQIKRLYFPAGYYRITDGSFYATMPFNSKFDFNFEEVIIPGDIEEVSGHSFQNCKNLEKVVFKEGVRIIEGSAFKDCSIKEVVFSDTVESISKEAFWGNKITSITIPKISYRLDEGAFGHQDIKYFNDLSILSNKNLNPGNYLGAGKFTRAFLDNRALKENTKDKPFFQI